MNSEPLPGSGAPQAVSAPPELPDELPLLLEPLEELLLPELLPPELLPPPELPEEPLLELPEIPDEPPLLEPPEELLPEEPGPPEVLPELPPPELPAPPEELLLEAVPELPPLLLELPAPLLELPLEEEPAPLLPELPPPPWELSAGLEAPQAARTSVSRETPSKPGSRWQMSRPPSRGLLEPFFMELPLGGSAPRGPFWKKSARREQRSELPILRQSGTSSGNV